MFNRASIKFKDINVFIIRAQHFRVKCLLLHKGVVTCLYPFNCGAELFTVSEHTLAVRELSPALPRYVLVPSKTRVYILAPSKIRPAVKGLT